MNKNSFCSCTCHKVTCMDLYEDAVFTTAHDDRKKRSWWEINLPFGMMRKIWRHAFFSLWQYLKMARSTVPSMAAVSRWLASFTALDCLFCSLAPPNITLVAQQPSRHKCWGLKLLEMLSLSVSPCELFYRKNR